MLMLAPSVALAVCAGTPSHCRCEAPCCCGTQGKSPAPAPATPPSASSQDQPALLATTHLAGAAGQVAAVGSLAVSVAPLSSPAPLFLTRCAFRC